MEEEEEEAGGIPPPPQPQPPLETLTLDDPSATQRKHLAMLDRLSNLHQCRLNARRSDSDSSASPAFESVPSFLSLFSESKRSIESNLDRCRQSSTDPKSDLDNVSAAIVDLEKLVADNSYFLPSYEVRSSLKAISDLKEKLEKATSDLIPRKKFSFRSKSKPKDPSFLVRGIEDIRSKVENTEKPSLGGGVRQEDSPGFRNKEGAVLVKKFWVSEEGEGDFTLSDLNSCDVYLKGKLRALFIHRIKNCRIFAGSVLGSILIEEVNGCLLMLASHQIRIHEARETDFYLRVRSRPIIEGCRGVRFAPYRLVYEGIEEELRSCGLGEETGNWANVDDFKWLRAVQSPNWCVIPEEERVGIVDVSDFEEQCDGS